MGNIFKLLQKQHVNEMKKQIPKLTKEYCHKWYKEHNQMKDIIPEQKFVEEVNRSVRITIKNNDVQISLQPFKTTDIEESKLKVMESIWDDFGSKYKQYIVSKLPKIFG